MNAPAPTPGAAAETPAPPANLLVTAFLDAVPDRFYFKDRESRFLVVGRAKYLAHGFTSAREIVGKTDFDLFAHDHAQRARNDDLEVMLTGRPVIGKDEKISWPDGRVTWGRATKMPLRDATGAIIGTFGYTEDTTRRKEIELALDTARKNLVEASRAAGMAEVATGVLHNVGNVLNSLNVSASVIATGLRQSKADSLAKLAALLRERHDDLGRFLTDDPKGRRVPDFIESLARHFADERDRLLQEVASLQQNVDHIKEIVSMQQAYATMVGVVEAHDPVVLMEDALRINAGALVRHGSRVERDFQPAPRVLAEKAKVLQILVNLIRNAKYACDERGAVDKVITLRIEPVLADAGAAKAGEPDRVRLVVADNGIGVPPENLVRIFNHGFTTRATGHGFGLHSAANAAAEMKGSLTVHSAGPNTGAAFTLELPVAPVAVVPAAA